MFRILSERMRLPSHSSNEGSDGGAQVFHPSTEENITIIWNIKYYRFFKGFLKYFSVLSYSSQHCFICSPSDPTVSEDAGIEPRPFCDSGIGSQTLKPLGEISSTKAISLPQLG